jgi:hypothetical protein
MHGELLPKAWSARPSAQAPYYAYVAGAFGSEFDWLTPRTALGDNIKRSLLNIGLRCF